MTATDEVRQWIAEQRGEVVKEEKLAKARVRQAKRRQVERIGQTEANRRYMSRRRWEDRFHDQAIIFHSTFPPDEINRLHALLNQHQPFVIKLIK